MEHKDGNCDKMIDRSVYINSNTVLISSTKSTTKKYSLLFRDIDVLKLISDDKNYDKMYAASSFRRRYVTKMLFETSYRLS